MITSTPGIKESIILPSTDISIEHRIVKSQYKVREEIALGDWAAALPAATASKELIESTYGARHPVFASACNNIAYIEKQQGK